MRAPMPYQARYRLIKDEAERRSMTYGELAAEVLEAYARGLESETMARVRSSIDPGTLHRHKCSDCGEAFECTERHSVTEQDRVCEHCLVDVGIEETQQ